MVLTRSTMVVNEQTSNNLDARHQRPFLRTVDFWRRVSAIYLGYKVAQVRASVMRWCGHSELEIKQNHWQPVHDKSGQDMYQLCVDMRGFLIKVPFVCNSDPYHLSCDTGQGSLFSSKLAILYQQGDRGCMCTGRPIHWRSA
jgi:hypothetical protein